MELVAAAGLISAVSVMSFFQVKNFQKKSLQKEAKIQLSQFYQGQAGYKFDEGEYAKEIEEIVFPQGALRYNVGFKRSSTNPTSTPGGPSGINNFWELCHTGKKQARAEKKINNEDSNKTITTGRCFFRTKSGSTAFPPPSILNSSADADNTADPKTFKAYARGNLEEDDNVWCKEEGFPQSDLESKIDEWTINQKGELKNDRGPFASSSVPTTERSTVCENKI